jgi:hypothetical protein
MIQKHAFTCLLLTIVAFLVAAWVLNFYGQFGFGTRYGKFDHHFTFHCGSASISQQGNFMVQGFFWKTYPDLPPDLAEEIGTLSSLKARLSFSSVIPGNWRIEVPIILLITAIIPLVVGSLSRFRFRLWQFFAFTAVVAVELAYFLR